MTGGIRRFAMLAALSVAGSAAHAQTLDEGGGGHYAAMAFGADEADSYDLTAELGLPLGERGWLHGALGASQTSLDTGTLDTRVASLTAGFDGDRIELYGGYAYRDDGDAFTQHDFFAQFTLRGTRAYGGIELFYRMAEAETVASIERRLRDPLSIRIEESIEGTGIGLRGGVDVAEHLEIFASGMTYDYDSETNRPALVQRLPTLLLSGISREEAFLEDTWTLGATLTVATTGITMTYTRDRTALLHEVTDTAEITVDIALSERWNLAPQIGYSDRDAADGIGFASLHLSVVW
jgi:hypothetical protein